MATTLVLTGATGFLGRHILAVLAQSPRSVRVMAWVRDVARAQKDMQGWQMPEVTWHAEPVPPTSSDHVPNDTFSDARCYVHAAAMVSHRREDKAALYRANVDSTAHVARLAARQRARLIFVSTSGTVGCSRTPRAMPDETAPWCESAVGSWPYYASKIAAERLVLREQEDNNLDAVIVRPPIMYGPCDPKGRASSLLRKFLAGRLPVMIQGGTHFVDVRDVAQAIVRAIFLPKAKKIYHLPGTAMRVPEFFDLLSRVAQRPPPRWTVPYSIAWAASQMLHAVGSRAFVEPILVQMARHYWGLSSLYAHQDLMFSPRPAVTTLSDAVHDLRHAASQ